jgi:hypothetical protein
LRANPSYSFTLPALFFAHNLLSLVTGCAIVSCSFCLALCPLRFALSSLAANIGKKAFTAACNLR